MSFQAAGGAGMVPRTFFAGLFSAWISLGISNHGIASEITEPLHDLSTIAGVGVLEGPYLSIDARPSTVFAAYERVISSSFLDVDDLFKAYDRASVAGKLYVAAAILNKDRFRGGLLLNNLGRSRFPILTLYGCVMTYQSAGSVAHAILEYGGIPSSSEWRQ